MRATLLALCLLTVAFTAAVPTVPPVGSLLWNHTIPGQAPWRDFHAGMFHGRYYATVTVSFMEPKASFFFTVLDASMGGKKLLQIPVGPLANPNGYNNNEVADMQVFENGLACVMISDGRLYCGSTATGNATISVGIDACQYPSGETGSGLPSKLSALDATTIAVACGSPALATINATSGQVMWGVKSNQMPGEETGALPSGDSGYLVSDANLVAYNLSSQTEIWSVKKDHPSGSIFCATRRVVVFVVGNELLGVNASTGKTLWHAAADALVFSSGAHCSEDQLWLTAVLPSVVYATDVVALSMKTGKEQYRFSGTVNSLVFEPSESVVMNVMCTQDLGHKTGIAAFDSRTGAQLWNTTLPLCGCNKAPRVLHSGFPVLAPSPVTKLPNGDLLVPNLIGVNYFSVTTGERIVSGGRGALQFFFLAGLHIPLVHNNSLIVYNQLPSTVSVEAYAL